MLSTFAVCFWATTAFAACNVKTRVHYIRADDRSRGTAAVATDSYFPERLQSRASSMFGPTTNVQPQAAATGFPYRFVFPANHPALNRPVYPSSQFVQNSQQSESLYSAEDLFSPSPSSKHHPLSDYKSQQQQQQQQQQQPIGYETIGKVQYEYFGGGGGGGGKHLVQPPPYHLIKQPKHYQSFELGPNAATAVHHQPAHQPSFYPPSTSASVAQPIMLLIPSSGQPGAPYQTLVLVPSSASTPPSPPPPPPQQQSPVFTGFHPQIHHLPPPAQFLPGFVPHPRGPPLVAGFPSGLGGGGIGLGRFPGAQLFHRSHEPLQKQQQQHQQPHHYHHNQHQYSQQKSSQSLPSQSSSLPSSASYQSSTSYQGSGSANVQHTTATGSAVAAAAAAAAAAAQQPLEDKVSHGSGASGENSDDRSENSAETKREEKSPEFGDKTTAKLPKRIVVT